MAYNGEKDQVVTVCEAKGGFEDLSGHAKGKEKQVTAVVSC